MFKNRLSQSFLLLSLIFLSLAFISCAKESNEYSTKNTAEDNLYNLILAINNKDNNDACYLVSQKFMNPQECNFDLNNDLSVLKTSLQNNLVDLTLTEEYNTKAKQPTFISPANKKESKTTTNNESTNNKDNKNDNKSKKKSKNKSNTEKIIIVNRNNKRTVITMIKENNIWKLSKIN